MGRLTALVRGSAAGGGFLQWNCRCATCRLAWAGDARVGRAPRRALPLVPTARTGSLSTPPRICRSRFGNRRCCIVSRDEMPQVARTDAQRHAWPEHWINRHVALSSSAMVHKPLGMLAELTHRCPLGCPYCSNPLALDAREDELDTATWMRVFGEAAG